MSEDSATDWTPSELQTMAAIEKLAGIPAGEADWAHTSDTCWETIRCTHRQTNTAYALMGPTGLDTRAVILESLFHSALVRAACDRRTRIGDRYVRIASEEVQGSIRVR